MFRALVTFASAFAGALATFDIDSSPNAVGICYSVWHSLGYDGTNPPPDITDIENGVGGFQGQGVFHFWGRPDGGYYTGSNRAIIARHFSQISGAGIDFIAIDATNLQGYGGYQPGLFTEPTDYVLDELLNQRAAGNPTPSIVFWVRSEPSDADPGAVIRWVRDRYMHNPGYTDFFVNLNGKPLILTTNLQPEEFTSEYTLRTMWGLQPLDAPNKWSFLQDYPQGVGYDVNGTPEQVSVCTAKQQSYISDKTTATSRAQGQTYAAQWSRAFDVHPKVVMLTWWNEWMAQRQADDANGNPQFVDAYDSEYSRDIEPQDPNQPGSHGSRYLDWTRQYVAAYKANQPIPQGLVGY